MESLLQDARYALRQLSRLPGFTLTAILTLAFGIGATTAIFSIVEGVLLRPLPFPAQASLVTLGDKLEGVNYGDGEVLGVTAPGVQTYMRDTQAFSSLGGFQTSSYELSGLGEPSQINAARFTASMFSVLGVSPLIGRVFTQREDESSQQLVVLSYQTWQSRYHGDPRILGQKVLLDRKPYEIVGVMPRDFEFPLTPGQLNRSELWAPMSFTQAELVQGSGAWAYYLVGRLKPGLTPTQAQQDAAGAAQEIMRNFPPALSARRIHPVVEQLDEVTIGQARPLVRTLFLAVTVVLFIACANLAGLLLVRVIRRRREISVRIALGASAAAVLRQSLVETLILSVSGGLLGLALAWVALRIGLSFLPETLPRVSSIALDWQVVAFALSLAVLTGLFCGLIPAISAARTGVNEALKEGGRTGSAGGGHARLRSSLVVAELAVALVLLTASGLLLRSFQKMRAVDLGFRADHTLTASYSLPRQQYSTQPAIDAFNRSLRSQLEQLPGVQAVGFTTMLPAADVEFRGTFTPDGFIPPKGAGLNLAWIPQVMGSYFQAQGIPIIRGRDFNASDDLPDAQLVTIVNRKLAEHYWPGQDPIGKRLHRGPARATTLPWLTVVGEIGDVKQETVDGATAEQFYIPSSQVKAGAGSFATATFIAGNRGVIVVRGQMQPEQMAGSLRAVVHSLDPQLPLTDVESMDHVVGEGQASRRFNTALISAFAAAAVLLALLGIYSVIAFSAALRTHEMAIRLALGAQRNNVMRLILFSAARLGLAGCLIGGVAAIFATRLVRSMLFQVDPLDPTVIAFAIVAVFLLTLAASLAPARHAAAIEPVEALRTE
ncbi:MAG: ABC transporter permease [Terracidiphilus sp.]|jgi:predicted permease